MVYTVYCTVKNFGELQQFTANFHYFYNIPMQINFNSPKYFSAKLPTILICQTFLLPKFLLHDMVIPFCFLYTSLHGLANYTLSFSQCLFPLYLNHLLTDFNTICSYYCLAYSCSATSRPKFRIIPPGLHLKLFQSMLYTAK